MKRPFTPAAPGRAPTSKQQQPPARALRWLRGPIPIEWLCHAARLPGRSLHVAIAARCLCSSKQARHVELSNSASQPFGLDRNAKYRGLACLERAGLVAVRRKLGRSPIVTIGDTGGGDERQS